MVICCGSHRKLTYSLLFSQMSLPKLFHPNYSSASASWRTQPATAWYTTKVYDWEEYVGRLLRPFLGKWEGRRARRALGREWHLKWPGGWVEVSQIKTCQTECNILKEPENIEYGEESWVISAVRQQRPDQTGLCKWSWVFALNPKRILDRGCHDQHFSNKD